MQSSDQHSDPTSLQLQLQLLTDKFDKALKKDMELGELKKIFHEMKKIKMQLEESEEENARGSSLA
jgi:hypothetical protein